MAEKLPRRDLGLDDLKALAHPLRQRILYHLASTGTANSTSIARAFDESTGTTSYHLRQLERYGFVEEVPERATGRERWWRLVPLDIRGVTDEAAEIAETKYVGERLSRVRLERDREVVDRFLRDRHRFADWEDAVMFSSSIARMTKEELAEFTEQYVELLKRFWRTPEEAPQDARAIAVLFQAFPWPGESDRA